MSQSGIRNCCAPMTSETAQASKPIAPGFEEFIVGPSVVEEVRNAAAADTDLSSTLNALKGLLWVTAKARTDQPLAPRLRSASATVFFGRNALNRSIFRDQRIACGC